MFSDSVPASQIPALVLGIWTGSFESLTDRWHRRPQCENSWLLLWSQEKCREINWIYFFHVSPDEKIWSQNKKKPLQKKKKKKKSQIVFKDPGGLLSTPSCLFQAPPPLPSTINTLEHCMEMKVHLHKSSERRWLPSLLFNGAETHCIKIIEMKPGVNGRA